MKRLLSTFVFVLIMAASFAADKEIVIIRVDYLSKKSGIESRLYCDIGNSNKHSLYRLLVNQENTVQIKDENDKMLVFTTEVDLMNYLFTLGYTFKETYLTEVISTKYVNFVLVKE